MIGLSGFQSDKTVLASLSDEFLELQGRIDGEAFVHHDLRCAALRMNVQHQRGWKADGVLELTCDTKQHAEEVLGALTLEWSNTCEARKTNCWSNAAA